MVTVADIEAAVEAHEFSDDFWPEFGWASRGEKENLPGLGEIVVVDRRDDPGDGQEMWIVFSLGDQFFRKTGYYSSWDGSSWDGALVEVEPYVEPVTFYRVKTN